MSKSLSMDQNEYAMGQNGNKKRETQNILIQHQTSKMSSIIRHNTDNPHQT